MGVLASSVFGGNAALNNTYPEVNDYTALPAASSAAGEIYVVLNGSGIWPTRKQAGLYVSDGATWTRLGVLSAANVNYDNTTSGLTANDVKSALDELASAGGGVTDHGLLTGLADDDHTQYSLISSQVGAPISTPSRVGEINIDTAGGSAYVSTGTASSADWEQIDGVTAPGGSDTQIQYNDGGVFGGAANLTFDATTGAVAQTGTSDIVQLTVKGNATQTANIFEVRDSSSNTLLSVNNNGELDLNGRITQSGLGRSVFVGDFTGTSDNGANNVNVGIGRYALYSNVSGQNNVAIGVGAGQNILTSGNVGVGGYAGQFWKQNSLNTAIGYNSSTNVGGGGTVLSGYNVSVGAYSLFSGGLGNIVENTAIGSNALKSNQTGNGNTALGFNSLTSTTGINYSVAIGYNAGSTLSRDNTLIIENSTDITTPLIYGEFDNNLLRTNGNFEAIHQADNTTVIKGYSTQTNNILEIQDSSGSTLIGIDNGGLIEMPTTTNKFVAWSNVKPTVADYGIAIGHQPSSRSFGSYSINIGHNTNTSTNSFSIAMGSSAAATGIGSISIGAGTASSGSNASVLGYAASSSGANGTAIGNNATVSGNYSSSIGVNSDCRAQHAFATGWDSEVSTGHHLSHVYGYKAATKNINEYVRAGFTSWSGVVLSMPSREIPISIEAPANTPTAMIIHTHVGTDNIAVASGTMVNITGQLSAIDTVTGDVKMWTFDTAAINTGTLSIISNGASGGSNRTVIADTASQPWDFSVGVSGSDVVITFTGDVTNATRIGGHVYVSEVKY